MHRSNAWNPPTPDMSDGLPDLPDEIEEKLPVDNSYDVQYHHYLKAILDQDEPWASVSTIERATGKSDETVRTRLADLEKLDVVGSGPGANGYIYWIKREKSEWPIPPDCEVDPVDENEELSVSDLADRRDVSLAAGAVFFALYASLAIAVPLGDAIAGVGILSPQLADTLILTGFATAVGAVLFGVAALGVWVYANRKEMISVLKESFQG